MKLNLLALDYKKNKQKITLVFIILSAISLLIVFLPFIIRGNYLAWSVDLKRDGATQHLTFFAYFDSVGIFNKIGSYDFFAGFGNDYMFSYIYYMLLDPFNIVLLIPINNYPLLYSFAIILKFFASGYFMFLYLRYKNIKPIVNIVCSIFYMLSGFAVFCFVRHPDLAAGAVFLPLMVYGLEKVMNNEKPYILIVSTFLCLCSSFYMFFMSSVFVVIYAVVYYFEITPKPYVFKNFILKMLKIATFYLIAIMLAAFFFIPLVYLYPSAARTVSKGFNFYNLKYYLGLMLSSVTSIAGSKFTPLGINIIVLALIIAFYKISGNKTYKILLAVLGIGMLMPLFGYAFNLFNYVNNRWIYLFDFSAAVAAAITLNHFSVASMEAQTKKKIKLILSAFVLVFAFLSIVYAAIILLNKFYTTLYLIIAIVLLLALLFLFIYLFLCILKEKILIIKYRFTFSGVLTALYILTVFMPAIYYTVYSKEFNDWNYFYEQQNKERQYLSEINKNEFFRTDTYEEGAQAYYNNNAVINGYMGTYSYNTLSNGLVYQFFNENGIYNQQNNLGIGGLNKRSAISSLLSVKYYLKNKTALPYGFNNNLTEYNNIYENSNYLPLGIVFKNSVSKQYYDSLSYVEKQALMLEAVVLENGESYNYTKKVTSAPYQMQLNDVTIENNVISVNKAGGSITLTVDDAENKELYLKLVNLVPIENNKFFNGMIQDKRTFVFNVASGGENYYQSIDQYGEQMYTGQKDFVFCLGYEKAQRTVTISFDDICQYSFDSIGIDLYALDAFQSAVDKLKSNSLKNVTYDNNNISGDITVDEECYLFLSVPYSKGFTAFVNGKPSDILKADTAFMAVKLEKGYNKIELCYKTPYFDLGIYISLASLALLIAIIIKDVIALIKKNKLSSKNT